MELDPSHVDYFARDAVRSLWMFPGVSTSGSCSGHLEWRSGDARDKSKKIVQYIPGLKETAPGIYELGGKPIGLEEFTGSFYHKKNSLIVRPLEYIYSDIARGFKAPSGAFVGPLNRDSFGWSTLYVYFNNFDTRFPETEALESALEGLFSDYEDLLNPGFKWKNSFYGSGISATNHTIEELKERQDIAISFWEDLESECKWILMNYGIPYDAKGMPQVTEHPDSIYRLPEVQPIA